MSCWKLPQAQVSCTVCRRIHCAMSSTDTSSARGRRRAVGHAIAQDPAGQPSLLTALPFKLAFLDASMTMIAAQTIKEAHESHKAMQNFVAQAVSPELSHAHARRCPGLTCGLLLAGREGPRAAES
eukprot:3090689-Rhodomonas_salina.2